MSFRVRTISYSAVFLGLAVAAGLLASEPLAAQPQSPYASAISGVVTWEEGSASLSGLQVEVNDRGGRHSAWADVRPDGTFEIRSFGADGFSFNLRVRDERGQIIHDDVVQPQPLPLEIHLRAPEHERPITGVVSAEELLNEVPKKAMREFHRAQQASEKGDMQRAIGHLRKAIRIHPQFVEAHNGLGVKFMRLQDFEQAAASFEEALRLKPDSPEPLSNLGIALHGLRRFVESEKVIRRALELKPDAIKTRFALALVLSAQTKEEEALSILAEVAERIPEAHIYSAHILGRRADSQGALREVRAYLDSGEQKHRDTAERWLRGLQ
jgi:tetratricopeptide (TPR) repeat protein